MGAWSTAILGNDTACEVAEYFKRMYQYQEGGDFKWTVEQITDSLYTDYFDTIKDLPSVKCDLFFALALSLWKRGELTEQIKEIVRSLIYDKIDYNAWKELDADEKTLKSRWLATTKFYESLDQPCTAVKKRVLQERKVSLFQAGTCLAVAHERLYYGILVAGDGRNVDDGGNDLLFVNVKTGAIPSIEDFKNATAILTDDLAGFFKGGTNERADAAVVAHTFNFSKSAMKKFQKSSVLVGRLDLTRTFFESSSVRFEQLSTDHRSVDLLLQDAFIFWRKQPWRPSGYKLQYECKVPFNSSMLGNDYLVFNGQKFPLSDVFLKIENSLWHINVTIKIKNSSNSEIEKCWTHFVTVIEHLTAREVNHFSIADETTEGLQAFSEIDFSNFRMKHIRDL